MYPKAFESVIRSFQKLPGVGKKTAERYAYTLLNMDEESYQEWLSSFVHMKEGIQRCSICGNLSEEDHCSFCSDPSRDNHMICVVQSPKDIAAIESMQTYNGVYHVLDGLIDTKKGLLPDQLNLNTLLSRVDQETKEVILALDPTLEGETTSLYIEKLLKEKTKVTRLAHGIPIGSHLDYTDTLTLLKAFQGRK